MNESFKDCVVVITGASSGIGRATAREFARQGARVVLAARREAVLREVEDECVQLGGQALAVPTDVTRLEDVERLAQAAVARFGRIDVWFNNAGVGVFGPLVDIPPDAWRRVIETNVFGCMHGARAVLPQFRAQRRGVLINNASIVGLLAKPDSTAYATSKFAIRGFAESLRQELLEEPGIHVCTILPSVIDTLFFQHAGNYSRHRVRAAPPVYAVEKVVNTVMELVRAPRAEVVIGGFGRVMSVLKVLLPTPIMRVVNAKALHHGFLASDPAPVSSGALFTPMEDGLAVSGDWRHGINNGGVPLATFTIAALAIGWLGLRSRRR